MYGLLTKENKDIINDDDDDDDDEDDMYDTDLEIAGIGTSHNGDSNHSEFSLETSNSVLSSLPDQLQGIGGDVLESNVKKGQGIGGEVVESNLPGNDTNEVTRRQASLLVRSRIGHTEPTHKHLLVGNLKPPCPKCGVTLTIDHILNDCFSLNTSRINHFGSTKPSNLLNALNSSNINSITNFLKTNSILLIPMNEQQQQQLHDEENKQIDAMKAVFELYLRKVPQNIRNSAFVEVLTLLENKTKVMNEK